MRGRRGAQDRRYVELERRIVAARLWALRSPAQTWRDAAAFLEAEFPQRWAVHEGVLDDGFGDCTPDVA